MYLRKLIRGELAPSGKTVKPPQCLHCRTNQGELFRAFGMMRGEWVTCKSCAQDGLVPTHKPITGEPVAVADDAIWE